MQQFELITDKFRTARGGYSRFLNIYCSHCCNWLLLYQKDGPGPLKRMYLDRIIAPPELVKRQPETLQCTKCHRELGIKRIYQKEKRPAYLLFAYSTVKQLTKGIFPPQTNKIVLKKS